MLAAAGCKCKSEALHTAHPKGIEDIRFSFISSPLSNTSRSAPSALPNQTREGVKAAASSEHCREHVFDLA